MPGPFIAGAAAAMAGRKIGKAVRKRTAPSGRRGNGIAKGPKKPAPRPVKPSRPGRPSKPYRPTRPSSTAPRRIKPMPKPRRPKAR